MALYGMPISAGFGLALTAATFTSLRRRLPAYGVLAGWALIPLVIWQVALPEYATETRRLACRASAASGAPYSWCTSVPYEPPEDGTPVYSARERLAIHGFNHVLAAGGFLTGHCAVAWETLQLSYADAPGLTPRALRQRPLSKRARRCRLGAGDTGPEVTWTSDFFLDSAQLRGPASQLARELAGRPVGATAGPVSAALRRTGTTNNSVYRPGPRRGPESITLGTALALYVPRPTLTATRRAGDRIQVTWAGPIYYPPRAAFSIPLPTLHGTYDVRLDEAIFCGLQMDGAAQPYRLRWTTTIPLDDPRLRAPQVHASDPGRFERLLRWVLAFL